MVVGDESPLHLLLKQILDSLVAFKLVVGLSAISGAIMITVPMISSVVGSSLAQRNGENTSPLAMMKPTWCGFSCSVYPSRRKHHLSGGCPFSKGVNSFNCLKSSFSQEAGFRLALCPLWSDSSPKSRPQLIIASSDQ